MKKFRKAISVAAAALFCAQLLPLSGCSKEAKIPQYSISTSATAGGSISASTAQVEQGDDVVFTLTPDEGYVLDKVTVNGGEVEVVGDRYVFTGVINDLNVQAVFVKTDVTVSFAADGYELESKTVKFGKTYGELPTAIKAGKRFSYWEDEDGERINSASIVEKAGDITLTAVWQDITDAEREKLVPYTATTAYFDAAATKYGVAFHTGVEPICPQILITTSDDTDFSEARMIECEYDEWIGEYAVNGVIDGLEFNTEYSVKFGDWAADVWSNTYTFKTREEQIDDVSFIYVTDTQWTSAKGENASGAMDDTHWSVVMTDAITRFPDSDFIAHGGDIVNYAAEPWQWQDMIGSVEEYLFNYPMMVVAGNHDAGLWYTAGYETVGKVFNMNVADSSYAGLYYSFDYGPMHFVSFNTNETLDAANGHDFGEFAQAELDWLIADLEAARANPNVKWIVWMQHMGIYIPTAHYDYAQAQMSNSYFGPMIYPVLMPILDEYNVDIMLYGHNHYICSTYPLIWNDTVVDTVYSSHVSKNIDIYDITPVTTTTTKTLYDGVYVDEFVYPAGTTDKGTVLHQTGTAGDQVGTRFPIAQLEQHLAKDPEFRMVLTGGKGSIDNNAYYSMYSYVEIDAGKLVCRTYGVDVVSQYASPSLSNGKYLDGFMLTK